MPMLRHTVVCTLVLAVALAGLSAGQSSPGADEVQRLDTRIQDLRDEAARLARQSKTLVTELRALEVERDLRITEAARTDAAVKEAHRQVAAIEARLTALEAARVSQLPQLETQLADLYKRGRLGHARLLFAADDVRAFGRTSRTVAAMAASSARRIQAHRRTLAALRDERQRHAEALEGLKARQTDALAARAAAAAAVTARTNRLNEIDARRDLTAQYVGELQSARELLAARLGDEGAGGTAVPLAPFRGALGWPARGRVMADFGDATTRLGGSAVRNGIEIGAVEGGLVSAVHGGRVVHADVYPGFGQLVILDHGLEAFSLYGYLGRISVAVGATVAAGGEVGRVGRSPGGAPALYFELRIDGRSVDPVQWLQPR
jgi:septal ring factor EnvC (AmiA/AmiB activator)